jgi:microcystin-dependent protein
MAVTIVRTTSSSQLGSLLSQASASATYLTKASASVIYTPQVPGIISQYIGATAPSGYLLCDGSPVSRTTYSALWDVLRNGTSSSPYGNGDGTTTFNVPNLQGKVPVGIDTTQTEFDSRGETGGEKSVTLTSQQSGVPAHSHPNSLTGTTTFATNGHTHAHVSPIGLNSGQIMSINPGDGQLDVLGSYNIYDIQTSTAIRYEGTTGTAAYERWYVTSSGNSSSGTVDISNQNNTTSSAAQAHTNLQPYITVNYIIKF